VGDAVRIVKGALPPDFNLLLTVKRVPMNNTPVISRRWLTGMAAAFVLSPAFAGDPSVQSSAPSSPEAVYQKERAACLDGSSHQDRDTCLQEAGAARGEASGGRLDNGEDRRALADNAVRHCQAVAPENRGDCERMARGEGQVSGSVEGGGVLKEIVTRSVEPAVTSPAPPISP